MKKNQLCALLCSLGVISTSLSHLLHTSDTISTILLMLGGCLVGVGFVMLIKKGKDK